MHIAFECILLLFKDSFSTLANFGIWLLSSVVFDATLINFKGFFHINWTGEHWSKHSNGSKQEQVCTHCYNIASKNLNREFCKSLYILLEPNAAEALPCNHHKSMDLLSSWFLKIFSVRYWVTILLFQSWNLHCKFLQKVVLPSLP